MGEFWQFLEQIRTLYANRDGYSYICVAFRELHSEKQLLEENTQNYIQKSYIHLSCARKLYNEIKL